MHCQSYFLRIEGILILHSDTCIHCTMFLWISCDNTRVSVIALAFFKQHVFSNFINFGSPELVSQQRWYTFSRIEMNRLNYREVCYSPTPPPPAHPVILGFSVLWLNLSVNLYDHWCSTLFIFAHLLQTIHQNKIKHQCLYKNSKFKSTQSASCQKQTHTATHTHTEEKHQHQQQNKKKCTVYVRLGLPNHLACDGMCCVSLCVQ
jgi:hypothetical protein